MGNPPNGISIGSAALHGKFVRPTSRETDTQTTLRATSVAIGCIYVVHAMQFKNKILLKIKTFYLQTPTNYLLITVIY